MTRPLFSAQVILDAKQHSRAEQLASLLRAQGFEVGPLRTGGMSITAPVEAFEALFGVSSTVDGASPFPGNELPLASLPSDLRKYISRVVFTTLDFGPNNF